MGWRWLAVAGLVLGCACGTEVVAPPAGGGAGGRAGGEGSTGGYEVVLPSDHRCRTINSGKDCCEDPECRFVRVYMDPTDPNDDVLMCVAWIEECSGEAGKKGKGGGIHECPTPYECRVNEDACGPLPNSGLFYLCQHDVPGP